MPVNIFLTGPIRYGKSTLLSEFNAENHLNVRGFFVQRLMLEGQTQAFRLADAGCEPYIPDVEVGDLSKCKNIFGYIGDKATWHPEVFDIEGTLIIRRALAESKGLLLMDELGRIELQAPRFQQAVFAALDSSHPVLGVLKQESNVFLDAIRSRSDVRILDLTKITHQEARQELANIRMIG